MEYFGKIKSTLKLTAIICRNGLKNGAEICFPILLTKSLQCIKDRIGCLAWNLHGEINLAMIDFS